MTAFMDWLKSKSVDTSSINVHKFDGFGHGLQANKELKVRNIFVILTY